MNQYFCNRESIVAQIKRVLSQIDERSDKQTYQVYGHHSHRSSAQILIKYVFPYRSSSDVRKYILPQFTIFTLFIEC